MSRSLPHVRTFAFAAREMVGGRAAAAALASPAIVPGMLYRSSWHILHQPPDLHGTGRGNDDTEIKDSLCKCGKASFTFLSYVLLVPLGLCPSASTSNVPAGIGQKVLTEGLGYIFRHSSNHIEGHMLHHRCDHVKQ